MELQSGTLVLRLVRGRHRPSAAGTGHTGHCPAGWPRSIVPNTPRRGDRGPLGASATDDRTDAGAGEGPASEISLESHESSNHERSASSRVMRPARTYRLRAHIDPIASRRNGGRSSRSGPRPRHGHGSPAGTRAALAAARAPIQSSRHGVTVRRRRGGRCLLPRARFAPPLTGFVDRESPGGDLTEIA